MKVFLAKSGDVHVLPKLLELSPTFRLFWLIDVLKTSPATSVFLRCWGGSLTFLISGLLGVCNGLNNDVILDWFLVSIKILLFLLFLTFGSGFSSFLGDFKTTIFVGFLIGCGGGICFGFVTGLEMFCPVGTSLYWSSVLGFFISGCTMQCFSSILYFLVSSCTLTVLRGQTDRGYKKPVTNTDIEIAIPLGMKRIPDSVNQYSFRYETDTG